MRKIRYSDVRDEIINAFVQTGKRQTVKQLAGRMGVSETTVRNLLGQSIPGGCERHTTPGSSATYGPTLWTLRSMLLAKPRKVAVEDKRRQLADKMMEIARDVLSERWLVSAKDDLDEAIKLHEELEELRTKDSDADEEEEYEQASGQD